MIRSARQVLPATLVWFLISIWITKLKLVLFVQLRLSSIYAIYLVQGNFTPSLPVRLITANHYSRAFRRILLKGFKWYKTVLQDWYLIRKKVEHVTPFLIDLQWLPIKQPIVFKIFVTTCTYKALNFLAPGYITDLLDRSVPTRSLRSSNRTVLLKVPSTSMGTVPLALPRLNCGISFLMKLKLLKT